MDIPHSVRTVQAAILAIIAPSSHREASTKIINFGKNVKLCTLLNEGFVEVKVNATFIIWMGYTVDGGSWCEKMGLGTCVESSARRKQRKHTNTQEEQKKQHLGCFFGLFIPASADVQVYLHSPIAFKLSSLEGVIFI